MISTNRESRAFAEWLFLKVIAAGDKAQISEKIVETLRYVSEWAGCGEGLAFVDPGTAAEWTDNLLSASLARPGKEKTILANQLTANCVMDIVAPQVLYQKDLAVTHILSVMCRYAGMSADISISRVGSRVEIRSIRPTNGANFNFDIELTEGATEAEQVWEMRHDCPGFWSPLEWADKMVEEHRQKLERNMKPKRRVGSAKG